MVVEAYATEDAQYSYPPASTERDADASCLGLGFPYSVARNRLKILGQVLAG